ncbi:MFS transporter [uncultured Salipiger sp.]|uniref:MFS transporter n=1 Tax=uncultured Salipiger sp. TaxID=499810 RepID=UPI00259A7214|nr:MFS transporter [uncultured Salipiger sp.]
MAPFDSSATIAATPEAAESVPVRLVLAAVAATLLFASLGQTIVSTALPVMVAYLGGMDKITWVMTAYLLASTIGAPVAGKLGDLYGRKLVLQWAIGVFILGAVLCGTAQNMWMVIGGRIIQGCGGGALIVTSMLGVGTASANMFRLIGGAVGTAGFGALFSTGMARNLAGQLPQAAEGGIRNIGAEMVNALPPETRLQVMEGISHALHPVFWIAAAAAVLACLASIMLRELPLSG